MPLQLSFAGGFRIFFVIRPESHRRACRSGHPTTPDTSGLFQKKSCCYRPSAFFFSPSAGHTVRIMVRKQAAPPMKLEMGSARNTP